jgi:4-amino-4-deoxychorismate lyase
MKIPILDAERVLSALQARQNPFFSQYKVFYSSWLGGIVKDPQLMVIPMDDHLVHRGDGVFEAIKFVNRRIFLLDEHLQRLFKSAERIGIHSPLTKEELRDLIFEVCRVADSSHGLIRLFLSRGPGGYTTNPYDSVGPQIYLTVTDLKPPAPELVKGGVCIGRSSVAVKEGWMAQVKSCNYLPNVMMKKEAVDRDLAFTVSFDESGFLAESSTENIALISESGDFTYPRFERILRGTTLVKVAQIAESIGLSVVQKDVTETEFCRAREVFMIGTTLDVLPVNEYEGQKIAGGEVGPISRQLLSELLKFQQDCEPF